MRSQHLTHGITQHLTHGITHGCGGGLTDLRSFCATAITDKEALGAHPRTGPIVRRVSGGYTRGRVRLSQLQYRGYALK